jgi:hypothetical protein
MNISCHVAPVEADIERNRLVEPEGERIRAELIEWLTRNKIVGVMLDTPEHVVRIEIAPKLPPRIKSVLTVWGSIFVKDERGAEGGK